MGFSASNGIGSTNTGNESLTSEAAAAVAAVVGLRQQQMRNHSNDLANFALPTLHSSKGGLADAIPLPKLGSPATSSQMSNSVDMGFPMPRLASPAIPSLHGLSGLSGLHLMQNFSGSNDLLGNSGGSSRRSGSATPTHTETKSSSDGKKSGSSSKSVSNGSDHAKKSEKNNNNRSSVNGERNDSIQDLSATSPLDKHMRFIADDFDMVDLDIHALPFKPSLREFLSASPTTSQPKFADDLSEFDHAPSVSPSDRTSNSIDLFKEVRDKIKMESVSENNK